MKKLFHYGILLTLAVFISCESSLVDQDSNLDKNVLQDNAISANSASSSSDGQYIVLFKGNKIPKGLEKKVSDIGGEVLSVTSEIGMAVVQSSNPSFEVEAKNIAGVQDIAPNIKINFIAPTENVEFKEEANPPFSGDNDFFFDLQWGHDAVDAPEAWDAGERGNGVRVAVLDGGFDLDHPDLAPNIDLGSSKNFVDGEDLEYGPGDTFSHGTHVAGTIAAADNAFGVIGIAPEATLVLVKVLEDVSGSGSFADIISGIVYAAGEGDADVINMSLGLYLFKNGGVLGADGSIVPVPAAAVASLKNALQMAVNYAHQQGATIIAAAGNEAINGQADKSGLNVPSDLAHVISISATAPIGWATDPIGTNLDNLASYSNYGNAVDFAAPGGDAVYPGDEECTIAGLARPCWLFDTVFSTGNNGWYWSVGTSMASPHAAGVAALIIGKNGGDMKPSQVETMLKKSADDVFKPGFSPYTGAGRVNAYNAVQ